MNLKFLFPLNFDYKLKFLGIIEYKVIPFIIIYGILVYLIVKSLTLSFFVAVATFSIIFLPPVLILTSKVYGEPFYSFIFAIIKHFVRKKIYLYKRVIWCGINISCFSHLYAPILFLARNS